MSYRKRNCNLHLTPICRIRTEITTAKSLQTQTSLSAVSSDNDVFNLLPAVHAWRFLVFLVRSFGPCFTFIESG